MTSMEVDPGLGAVWCEDQALLCSMFALPDFPCSELHSETHVRGLCKVFSRFVTSLLGDASPAWSSLDAETITALSLASSYLLSESVTWYPVYGCALLALGAAGARGKDIRPRLAELSLHMVCLDSWSYKLHSCSTGMQPTSVCEEHIFEGCGSIAADQHGTLLARIKELQAQSQRDRKDGEKGLQHTPAFMLAVVADALRKPSGNLPSGKRTLARGGYSEVGLHTGSIYRDTCWPLVRETIKAIMTSTGVCVHSNAWWLFESTMAHLDLWLLQRQAQLITAQSATATMVNAGMTMLASATAKAANLAAKGYDVASFESACHVVRAQISNAAAQRAAEAGRAHTLSSSSAMSDSASVYTRISGVVPAAVLCSASGGGLDSARLRSAANLGSLPLIPAGATPTAILTILKLPVWAQPGITEDVSLQLALSSIERHLGEMAALADLVDLYRSRLQSLLGSSAGQAAMRAELRSRELLVVWIAFCVMHTASSMEHPVLRGYGVSLCHSDLRHLVLSDRLAVDAALSVAAYLQQHASMGSSVFSLRAGSDATFEMALAHAESDPAMQRIWSAEQAAARARQAAHWTEVLRKQQLAAKLRRDLQSLGSELATQGAQLSRARGVLYSTASLAGDYSQHGAHSQAQSKVSTCEAAVTATQQRIKGVKTALSEAEKAPPPVIQPLPQSSQSALPWIFFLHMPPLLRHLSRISFLAQQMLIPCPWETVSAAITVQPYQTSLTSHYNTQQHSQYHQPSQPARTGTDGRVKLCSRGLVPAQVGPHKVDSFRSESDGVWHPDALRPEMAWGGSGSAVCDAAAWPACFNPFAAVDEDLVVQAFTAQLHKDWESLQWAMHQAGSRSSTPADRGNLAVAQQDARPDWLSKPGYLTLCNLRAYPLGQLRQLCVALHERNLPLGHPAVQVLIQQLLYHVGTLTDSSRPGLLWRTGWCEKGDVLETLCMELDKLATQLDQTPREHHAVPLLGEIAAYLSDWHAPCKAVARAFAGMTSRVADDLEAQIASAPRDQPTSVMQARQCLWRMRALLCYGGSSTEAQDAEAMVTLMVLINHGHLFFESESQAATAHMSELRVRCHRTMATHIGALTALVEADAGVLTAAVSRVLLRTPASLRWARAASTYSTLTDQLASYEAVGSDGNLYSINLLDGTVLLNGSPPSRLPRDILSHPVYTRSFGDRNFEVAADSRGVLQTVKPVGGCYYDFFLAAAGVLVVTEVDRLRGVELELLDVGRDGLCGSWGAQLPVRLREMHSHWVCRSRQVILLRAQDFSSHDLHFLIKYGATAAGPISVSICTPMSGSSSSHYICQKVTAHASSRHWTEVLSHHSHDLTHELVLHTSHTKTVLAKLEPSRYIHTYVPQSAAACSSQPAMLFELPRYNLQFQLQDGQLRSLDYSGYQLSQRQQLLSNTHTPVAGSVGQVMYTLPGFEEYLLLQRIPDSGVVVGSRRADSLVLAAVGPVQRCNKDVPGHAGPAVTVDVDRSSSAALKVHCYEVHSRFGHLRASDILPRLQLAALYAATGTLLPEPRSCLTGAQTAMQLVRQCWKNSPLTAAESAQLSSVADLGGHLLPALRLVVHELHLSASQVCHLHTTDSTLLSSSITPPALHPDAHTSYTQEAEQRRRTFLNPHAVLTAGEEQRVLGSSRCVEPEPGWVRLGHFTAVAVGPCPVASAVINTVEAQLSDCVQAVPPPSALSIPAYPLWVCSAQAEGPSKRAKRTSLGGPLAARTGGAEPPAGGDSPSGGTAVTSLELEMHAELRDSWDAFHLAPSAKRVVAGTWELILDQQASIRRLTTHMEAYLLQAVNSVPASVGAHGSRFRLLKTSGSVPSVSLADLATLAWQPQLLKQFNPFLSAASGKHIQEGVLLWLQLCVLQDRLGRLQALAKGGEDHLSMLIQELSVRRTWDVALHPQWLVFEAEGQLQIRPAQYTIANTLINNPGAIAQLNMGEGKTRVILPMLLLHWADGSRVVRLNFLTTLLGEAYSHLHNHMCASMLARKLFTLPFHRDVHITAEGARSVQACLTYCQQEGGMLLVAPEQRLSLQLKWHEMWSKRDEGVCSALQEVADMPYLDLLDESDELLHHRFQLIYACGTSMELPGGKERAQAIQALLMAISESVFLATDKRGILSAPGVAVWTDIRRPGAFSGVRLLPGKALEAVLLQLRVTLAKALVNNPPHELRWMRDHPFSERILRCMTEPSEAVSVILGAEVALQEHQFNHLLALRGLLACSILQHGLEKRHCVDFGVSRSPSARKRLAVPFRAAHTPAERSEFAQPDVALLLTHVSYYHDGLSKAELLAALKVLLGMGGNTQAAHYNAWLETSSAGIAAGDLEAVDSVLKIDTSNSLQLELLFKCFSHNMHVINFWLTYCVFPTETKQFPQRLACNAWHLADNAQGMVVGFSGTNDNHRLLPLQVKQHMQEEEQALKATNGKMLAVILDNPEYSTLATGSQGRQPDPTWKSLLDAAVGKGVHALLDCGALLAGISNRQAAEYLLQRLDRRRFLGVSFFLEGHGWSVLDTHGRCLPCHSSPIAEREAFVIFDDARCRGADLQLRRGAVGLLTLGPGMCKDKLMQAAGRLRQLGRGQTLRIIGTPDITAKIVDASPVPLLPPDITSLHVLRWVMHNTVQATLHGIPEWSRQGLHFAATKGAPERAMLDEVLQLGEFYGGALGQCSIADKVSRMGRDQFVRCEGRLTSKMQVHVDVIRQRSVQYGSSQLLRAGGAADEECERELEEEAEEEEEVEREIPRMKARPESDWDYAAALRVSSPSALKGVTSIVSLKAFSTLLQPTSIDSLGWSPSVFCTANFALAIPFTAQPSALSKSQPGALNEYLRPVNFSLTYPDGKVLLVSEREADGLLELIRQSSGSSSSHHPVLPMSGCTAGPVLQNLCYASAGLDASSVPQLAVTLTAGEPNTLQQLRYGWQASNLAVQDVVSLQLLNGQACYGDQQLRHLRSMVSGRREAAQALVSMRGKQLLFPRSSLELACD
ncbi:MAG: hypothetical protein WDW38_002512 [Sanguina aurantia]